MSYRVFLNKRLGIGVLATALVICFLGGLVIAKEMRRMPADGDTAAAAAPSMPAVPAVPGSFAELASDLGPSVVNIKVTKSADGVSWNMPEWFEHGPFEHFNRRFFDDQHRQRRERHDRPGHSQRIFVGTAPAPASSSAPKGTFSPITTLSSTPRKSG